MSALQTLANPRRIKATHRRRRKVASGRFVQRYYDTEIGRFITPDPVGPEEDFINHFNRYNYAQSNPVRYTDPDGREVVPVGTLAERGVLKTAIANVVKSNLQSAARYSELNKSNNVHTVRLPKPGEASENKTTGVKSNESVQGVGTGSESIVDPTQSVTTTNSDGTQVSNSGETVLTHELLGHGGDKDKGIMDRSINPETGEKRSEESAMRTENEYKDAIKEPRRDCHSDC